MTLLFLVMLVGLWGVLFLPTLLRARQGASPIVSVSTFNRGMRALGSGQPSANGRWIVMPPVRPEDSPRESTMQRRRRVFVGLVAASALTGLVGLLPSFRGVLWANLAVDVLLAGFVVFLVREKSRLAESRHSGDHSESQSKAVYYQSERDPVYEDHGDSRPITATYGRTVLTPAGANEAPVRNGAVAGHRNRTAIHATSGNQDVVRRRTPLIGDEEDEDAVLRVSIR